MTIHLQVYGYLWGGPKAVYQYSNLSAAPTTEADAKRIAGDFESLIDYRIVAETNTYETQGRLSLRVDRFKTLRGWRNGMSNRRYNRLVNGY